MGGQVLDWAFIISDCKSLSVVDPRRLYHGGDRGDRELVVRPERGRKGFGVARGNSK